MKRKISSYIILFTLSLFFLSNLLGGCKFFFPDHYYKYRSLEEFIYYNPDYPWFEFGSAFHLEYISYFGQHNIKKTNNFIAWYEYTGVFDLELFHEQKPGETPLFRLCVDRFSYENGILSIQKKVRKDSKFLYELYLEKYLCLVEENYFNIYLNLGNYYYSYCFVLTDLISFGFTTSDCVNFIIDAIVSCDRIWQ